MRVQRVVLEHHRDVAILGRHIVDQLVADIDLARSRLFQPGDHPQCGRLAATGRTDQHDKLTIGDIEVDPLHRRRLVKHLDDVAERNLRHLYVLLRSAPAALRRCPGTSYPSYAPRSTTT